MAKLYTKNTWVDEVLTGDEKYQVKNDAGAVVYASAEISLATSVAVAGTAVTATRMNNIEDGLDALDTKVAGIETALTPENVHAKTEKATPVDADEMLVLDSAASFGAKKITWASLKAALQAFFDTLYATPSNSLTFTNKRLTKRVGSTASSATPTPSADSHDIYTVTALAADATFGAPTGTPTDGQPLIIRIKDNGTARALAWNAIYRAMGSSLPTTTVPSKTLYLGFIYNSTDSKWDLIAKAQEA